MELYCAYTGQNWKCFKSNDIDKLKKEIEIMKDACYRPSHIIYTNCDDSVYFHGITNLWTPQHLIDDNNILKGGLSGTRNYFQRLLSKIKQSATLFDLDLQPSINNQIISSVLK